MNLFYNTQVIVVNASLNVKTLEESGSPGEGQAGDVEPIVPGIFRACFSIASTSATAPTSWLCRSRAEAMR